MVEDIVCRMGVEEDDLGTFSRSYEGKKYFFCSAECMLCFSRDPRLYVDDSSQGKALTKDLVCGMEVDENNPPFMSRYKGKTYYFCSHSCKREFEQNPTRFLA